MLALLDAAYLANDAHRATLTTTLGLLDTIEGFSATVEFYVQEMTERQRVCDENLQRLARVEEMLHEVLFNQEGEEGDAGSESDVSSGVSGYWTTGW